jgi:hypothetical protein
VIRALFVVSDTHWTGRARAMVAAARGLARRGHLVVLLSDPASAAHAQATREAIAGFDALPLPTRARRGGTSRVRALRRAIRLHESDVVLVHNESDHLAVALALVALRRKPALVRRIAVGERTRPTRIGRLADRLVPAAQLLTGRSGIDVTGQAGDGTRFRVELGVPLPAHEPAELASPTPLLVCTYDPAATVPASRALRAVTMLRKRHRHLTLYMIASDEVPERLRMQAAALGLSRVVRWVRAPGDMESILAQAWALIIAQGGDDAVFATLDAMAHGVPVVAPRGAIFERYVANGISGILLETFDAPACAAALATLVSDAERRSAMGGVARSRLAREYSEAEYVDALEAQLQTLGSALPNAAEPHAGVA